MKEEEIERKRSVGRHEELSSKFISVEVKVMKEREITKD